MDGLPTTRKTPMKRLVAGLLTFAAFTLPALAQFPSEFHTAAPRCAPMLEQTGLIETGYGSEIADIEGGCRLSAIYLSAGFPSRLRVESLEIRAPDLDIALVQGRQFEQARISLRQARISPVTSSPLQSYIIEMQTGPSTSIWIIAGTARPATSTSPSSGPRAP